MTFIFVIEGNLYQIQLQQDSFDYAYRLNNYKIQEKFIMKSQAIEGLGNFDFVFVQLFYSSQHFSLLENILYKCSSINYTEEWFNKEKLSSKRKLLALYQLAIFMKSAQNKTREEEMQNKIKQLKEKNKLKEKQNKRRLRELQKKKQEIASFKRLNRRNTEQNYPQINPNGNPMKIVDALIANGQIFPPLYNPHMHRNKSQNEIYNQQNDFKPSTKENSILGNEEILPDEPKYQVVINGPNEMKQEREKNYINSYIVEEDPEKEESNIQKSTILKKAENTKSHPENLLHIKKIQSSNANEGQNIRRIESRMEESEIQQEHEIHETKSYHAISKQKPEIDDTIKRRAETPKQNRKIAVYNIGEDIISSKLKMRAGERKLKGNFRVHQIGKNFHKN